MKRTLIEIVVVGILVAALLWMWGRGGPGAPPAPQSTPPAPSATTPSPPATGSVGAAADVATRLAAIPATAAPPTPPEEGAPDAGTATERVAAVARKVNGVRVLPPGAPPPSLSKDDIQRAIQASTPKIRACYESALKVQPNLAGRVVVEFHIEGDVDDDTKGTVTSGEIADSDVASPFFEACVLKEVAGVEFDAPKGGGRVTVRYPFHFSSDPDAGAPP